MMLRDITSIHDVLLAYHNKYKLIDEAGKYFKITNIEEAKTRSIPGYYVTLQEDDKQLEYKLDKLIENFKIVLNNKKR
jgi:hypothetical protein